MKSKYFPLLAGFIVVFCGTVYLKNPGGQHGLSQGLSAAVGYLPRFIIALVIGLAAGHVIALLSGKKRAQKAFSNGSLVIFLLIAALLMFKNGWVQDQLASGQQQLKSWISGGQHETSRPAKPSNRAAQHPSEPEHHDNGRGSQKPAAPQAPNLAHWAAQVNHQLPHRIDKYTQLSKVSYVAKSNTVFIRYDVDSFDALGIDEDEFVNRMRSNNQHEYCTGTFLKDPRSAKAHINVQYHYHYGGTIGEPIRLAPGSCH